MSGKKEEAGSMEKPGRGGNRKKAEGVGESVKGGYVVYKRG